MKRYLWCMLVLMVVVLMWAMPSSAASMFVDTINNFTSGDESGCWFCPVFETMFEVINTIAGQVSQTLSDTFVALLSVGILFFLLYKVGKALVSMEEQSLMKLLTGIMYPLGRAIFATIFLTVHLSVFSFLVNPVMQVSLGLAEEIMTTGRENLKVTRAAQSQGVETISQCEIRVDDSDTTQAFSNATIDIMTCLLKSASSSLILGMASGATITQYAFTPGRFGLPNWGALGTGLLLLIVYFLIFVMFPVKLLDGMVRLAFLAATMPLWIVAWVFPATADYTKKAWNQFLGSCLFFVILAIILSMILIIMDSALGDNVDAFFSAMLDGKLNQAISKMAISGKTFLLTLALGFLSIHLFGNVEMLSNMFIDVKSMGVGSQVTERGGKVASKGLSLAGQGIKKAPGATISAAKGAGRVSAGAYASAGRLAGKSGGRFGSPMGETMAAGRPLTTGNKYKFKDKATGERLTAKRTENGVKHSVVDPTTGRTKTTVFENGVKSLQESYPDPTNPMNTITEFKDPGTGAILSTRRAQPNGDFVETNSAGVKTKDKAGNVETHYDPATGTKSKEITMTGAGSHRIRKVEDFATGSVTTERGDTDKDGEFRAKMRDVRVHGAHVSHEEMKYSALGNLKEKTHMDMASKNIERTKYKGVGSTTTLRDKNGAILNRSAKDLQGDSRAFTLVERLSPFD